MHISDTDLEFFNGFGGFHQDGREYVITLEGDRRPPAPWINVIANRNFGFTVSETGAGVTWAYNSRENKITPWSNDPVSDTAGEAIYIRDNSTGKLMTPMSLGRDDRGVYQVRHGFGYSAFTHEEDGLRQRLKVFTPKEDPVKIWEVELENLSDREMHLSITYYVEWVLGTGRHHTNPYIITSFSNHHELLSAENVYSQDFRGYQGFIFSNARVTSYSADRFEVLGKGGSVRHPQGLSGTLSNTTGVGLDACGALQTAIHLEAGETRRVVFALGYTDDNRRRDILSSKYRHLGEVTRAFEEMQAYWEDILGRVQLETRDRAMDIMVNGWLMYQTIACRLYARTAFYQNGGAFGFRDQLQDGMALVYARPDMLREQILLSSSHQFEQGDVQHWWHPPTGVGVRTRITDDLLWLPYVTAEYIQATDDFSILEAKTPWLVGPELEEGEHDRMFVPEITDERDTLYEHCKRAIQRTSLGERGLPLMGGGDWNDGMDLVGIGGTGESVWLGWFFFAVLSSFIPLATHMGDHAYADILHVARAALRDNLNKNAWDGEWFLRAFYDDGSKLGSHENEECRIDSISQSWSILSGAGDGDKARQAFHSAIKHLVLEDEQVSLLLTPPFDKTEKNPGYIKNYRPGVRENGGQYTHAAIWLAIAAVKLGESERAYKLFSMLNPIHHARTREAANHYENEPYVVSADISYEAPYTGRGGWSWYTGSSAWLYQGLVRHFLGIRKEGDSLIISSCVPLAFGDYTLRYRYGKSTYIITVRLKTDETAAREDNRVRLKDDGQEHHILVETGCAFT